MSTELIFVILMAILVIIDVILVVQIARKEYVYSKEENNQEVDVELVKMLLSEKTIENIDTMIDKFISDAGDMYTLLKLSQDDHHYISREIEKEMTAYIYGTVKNNMTPVVRQVLGLTHNVDNEEDLDKYLNLRIKLYVLNFMVNYNQLQES